MWHHHQSKQGPDRYQFSNVNLHSESIYGEEIDSYTYPNTDPMSTDPGESVSDVYPLVIMPGQSAYISRDSELENLNKKEEFKKTTMEVDAIPVNPADAKELRSLVSVSNVKTEFKTNYDEITQENVNIYMFLFKPPTTRIITSIKLMAESFFLIKRETQSVLLLWAHNCTQ
ncbi:hypothetical protein JQC72_13780 [Polycladomyces sp. WAk]|uniref:Uncharacterized protein n=1 Tax=Polycladomyces zharkentensis TaxID=2807616 RepID=A0ABS2WM34_9BACL|nr:hypothetical protein [Polycladomyces sp. WAk]MBN2910572.1 hypothetical protein [Polycladomyces sp. WAk]